MKENSITLKGDDFKGLRRDYRTPRNTPLFSELTNLKPFNGSLVPIDSVAEPFYNLQVSWPMPQLFRGEDRSLLATNNYINSVVETPTNYWEAHPLEVYNLSEELSRLSPSATISPWVFASNFETWFLVNNQNLVFHNAWNKLKGLEDKTYVVSGTTINSCAYSHGRFLFGGWNPDYYNSDWKSFFEKWNSKVPEDLVVDLGLATNFVTWSSVGGGDVLWPLFKTRAETGLTSAHDATNPLYFDLVTRNQAGFIPMPFQGRVVALKPLGKHIIVYCDEGVGVLFPTLVGDFPTYGFQSLLKVGIQGKTAVGGSDAGHVFVDTSGFLYLIKPDLAVERLGYQEFFYPLISSTVVVTYDHQEREWRISNGEQGYLLNSQGLSKVSQLVTSLGNTAERGLVGVALTKADFNFALTTGDLDFGYVGRKFISDVEIGGLGLSNLMIEPFTRTNSDSTSFLPSAPRIANKLGVVHVAVSAVDHRLRLTGTISPLGRIDYITIRFKLEDKRFRRGLDRVL